MRIVVALLATTCGQQLSSESVGTEHQY